MTEGVSIEAVINLVALLAERDGQDFDGEAHLTSDESARIAAALSTLTASLEQAERERDAYQKAMNASARQSAKAFGVDKLGWLDHWRARAEAAEAELTRLRELVALAECVLRDIIEADEEFRASMSPDVDKDLLTIACDRGRLALIKLQASHEE